MSVFMGAALIISCSKNPITGRNQARLLPESELQSMANTQYQQFLSTNRVVSASNNRDAEMVKRVGQRVTRAVTEYFNSKGLSQDLQAYIFQVVGYGWTQLGGYLGTLEGDCRTMRPPFFARGQ